MSAKVKPVAETYLPFFVYGTLQSGQGNHHLFGPSERIGAGNTYRAKHIESMQYSATVRGFRMFTSGSYPACYPSDSNADKVSGQLIWVQPESYDSVLNAVDRLEGHPDFFTRIVVSVEYSLVVEGKGNAYTNEKHISPAWMYQGPGKPSGTPVPSGVWTSHVYSTGSRNRYENASHKPLPLEN